MEAPLCIKCFQGGLLGVIINAQAIERTFPEVAAGLNTYAPYDQKQEISPLLSY